MGSTVQESIDIWGELKQQTGMLNEKGALKTLDATVLKMYESTIRQAMSAQGSLPQEDIKKLLTCEEELSSALATLKTIRRSIVEVDEAQTFRNWFRRAIAWIVGKKFFAIPKPLQDCDLLARHVHEKAEEVISQAVGKEVDYKIEGGDVVVGKERAKIEAAVEKFFVKKVATGGDWFEQNKVFSCSLTEKEFQEKQDRIKLWAQSEQLGSFYAIMRKSKSPEGYTFEVKTHQGETGDIVLKDGQASVILGSTTYSGNTLAELEEALAGKYKRSLSAFETQQRGAVANVAHQEGIAKQLKTSAAGTQGIIEEGEFRQSTSLLGSYAKNSYTLREREEGCNIFFWDGTKVKEIVVDYTTNPNKILVGKGIYNSFDELILKECGVKKEDLIQPDRLREIVTKRNELTQQLAQSLTRKAQGAPEKAQGYMTVLGKGWSYDKCWWLSSKSHKVPEGVLDQVTGYVGAGWNFVAGMVRKVRGKGEALLVQDFDFTLDILEKGKATPTTYTLAPVLMKDGTWQICEKGKEKEGPFWQDFAALQTHMRIQKENGLDVLAGQGENKNNIYTHFWGEKSTYRLDTEIGTKTREPAALDAKKEEIRKYSTIGGTVGFACRVEDDKVHWYESYDGEDPIEIILTMDTSVSPPTFSYKVSAEEEGVFSRVLSYTPWAAKKTCTTLEEFLQSRNKRIYTIDEAKSQWEKEQVARAEKEKGRAAKAPPQAISPGVPSTSQQPIPAVSSTLPPAASKEISPEPDWTKEVNWVTKARFDNIGSLIKSLKTTSSLMTVTCEKFNKPQIRFEAWVRGLKNWGGNRLDEMKKLTEKLPKHEIEWLLKRCREDGIRDNNDAQAFLEELLK